MEPEAVVQALRRGVATLDALAARLGDPPRDELMWALDEALRRGWVRSSAEADGICASTAPTLYSAA